MNRQEIDILKNQVINGNQITANEAISLSNTKEIEYLCNAANEIRIHFTGNYIDLCSITNARSGKCPENCKWCSQSAFHNTDIEIYDIIDKEQALIQARNNHKKGVHKFSLVTSGKTVSDSTLEKLLEIYSDIKKEMNIHLCASMGLLNKEQLSKLKNAGIVHYHCNLETAPSYFNNLCTTHTIDEKLQTIEWAKEVGLEICSGGIVGMGESMEQRIELAFELRKIGAKSIPLNFLNPIKGTALENANPLSDDEVMITIALFRFINPDANIRFAGGRNMISHLEEKALNSGINAALVGDLLTTVGKNIDEDMEQFKKLGFNTNKRK
jgi:adenosylmethionine-8-amino-7-oxononanoate aminotransferase/biotin synthase